MKRIIKSILRKLIEISIEYYVVFLSKTKKKRKGKPKVFYSGAFSGNLGGARVKVKRLSEYYKNHLFNFDIVYVLSNFNFLTEKTILNLKSRKIPIILNQNGVFYSSWYRGDWKKMNKKMSVPYHESDYVFWQSKFCKQSAEYFLGKRKGRGEILYNAVDTNFFIPQYKKVNRDFTFLITGKIGYELNYRIEISILGLHNAIKKGLNFRLVIAGDIDRGVKEQNLQLIKELGIENKVSFLGKYSQKNAVKIYQMAEAYIMMKYLDPCPNTVIEAMSCGLPVLHSSSGGVPELVGSDAGVSLQVIDNYKNNSVTPTKEEVGSGMITLFENYEVLKKNARRRAVVNFDIEKWIQKHKIIFEKLKNK